ncbi:lactase/phlorizin hydrolase-like [Rhopalosiphum padi]|uniref:lactase/phlorizin hydrolase-like n=1 Tax=Rhopalosiphum padi TaxID=40932 RepID=UPI00298E482B|nr:lactase/phlorizin hydrolase-like [Rhopalosiphum padi]XP_060850737.1 lactase/phlorizin hydrolase-like [Rhopalosiphum padi]
MASEKIIQFPDDFLIGTGSAAYQIEGAWDADNKAPSIWDEYFHDKKIIVSNPEAVKLAPRKKYSNFHKGTDVLATDPSRGFSIVNGDIACDSYHKLDEDINNLVELGVNIYRFSISWPRVLPNVDDRDVNQVGVQYYQTLIEKLIANNITPMVTMYHWDLPNILQNLGGWSNPNIIEYFVNYSDFLFRTFGSQVKLWSTINEPRFVALAYGNEGMAPSVGESFNGIADYMAIRNELLAHAAVYKLYKKKYFAEQQGEISLCLDTTAYYPINPDLQEDRDAVSKSYDFSLGVFTHPLKNGTFPQSVIDAVATSDEHIKISIRRIIEFSEEEKMDLIGSYDFIAFNYYESFKVRPMTETEYKEETYLLNKDLGVVSVVNSSNMEDTFKGFTQVVDWFVENVNNPKLFVAENGIFEKLNVDESEKKIQYHRGILTELDKALKKGVVIKGYCVWSFMDSLEWTSGYFAKLFGIYEVDFNDPERPRSKKQSFEFFQTLFTTKSLTPIESDE